MKAWRSLACAAALMACLGAVGCGGGGDGDEGGVPPTLLTVYQWGLENVLVNQGPLTVFAPTDAAFAELPEGTVEELVKPENQATLSAIVTSHAAPGTYAGDLLTDGYQLYMATGHMVDVEVRDDGTYVNGAKILATVQATNGVVHVVDKVFLIAAN